MRCPKCKGTGRLTIFTDKDKPEHYSKKCSYCEGTGKVSFEKINSPKPAVENIISAFQKAKE